MKSCPQDIFIESLASFLKFLDQEVEQKDGQTMRELQFAILNQ